LKLIKEVFKNIFKTPNRHPRSQPFIDHILNFSTTSDGNIWIRNYQIVDNTGKLEEIGPRLVLEIIRVFDGSFCGSVLYDNPTYKSPNAIRRELKIQKAVEGIEKIGQKQSTKLKEEMIKQVKIEDTVGEVFDTNVKANEYANKLDHQILMPSRKRGKHSATKMKKAKRADDSD